MKIEIKTYWGELIFEGDFSSIADAVKAAVSANKSLSNADLRSADLSSADLSNADLRNANLRNADLSNADLRSANLSSADLRSANLRNADLSSANLRSADLRNADLSNADLSNADLRSADLRSAKNYKLAIAITRILPEGSIIGWKKLCDEVIAKLRIPEDAKRTHAFGRKCRAEFAEVLELTTSDGKQFEGTHGQSCHESTFKYHVGKTVKPTDPFNTDWTDECASGIHFFITREEAVAHLG